jgi:hypothetical protein
MDQVLTAPVEQPDAKQEWTTPTLKKLDLTETREELGPGGDMFLESGPI